MSRATPTRSLGNGEVELTLVAGAFRVEWRDVGVASGDLTVAVEVDGRRLPAPEIGAWRLEPGDAAGRPGTWATWQGEGPGPAIRVHLPTRGPVVVVQCSYVPPRAERLDRLLPLLGTVDLGVAPTRQHVPGYDSWAYAGVRAPEGATRTAWSTVLAAPDRAFGVSALGARRFATVVETDPRGPVVTLRVEQGNGPELVNVEGTGGYVEAPPPSLDLALPRDGEEASELVALAVARDPLDLHEELATLTGANMGTRGWSGAPIVGWESWYYFGLLHVTPEAVLDNARVMRSRLGERYDLVQIDDGWQVTYGAWWANDRFPDDLGELVRALRGVGCRAGLWLAPFMVQPDAFGVAAEHRDWLVTDPATGAPVRDRDGRWVVDGTNPEARAWLEALGRQVRDWGFSMVKLDFLYAAALPGRRDNRRATGTEALRAGLRAFLEGLGDRPYVLGCGMPLLPGIGIVHANRVGPDLMVPVLDRPYYGDFLPEWRSWDGVRAQARNVAARFAGHRRHYEHDPDVVMAWDGAGDPAGLTVEEARTLVTMALLCGGPYLLADDLARLAPDARAVLEHPTLGALAGSAGFRPLDLYDAVDESPTMQAYALTEHIPSLWAATRGSRRVLARFNWTDAGTAWTVPADWRAAVELWTSEPAGETVDVPAHGVRVLSV